MTLWRNLARRHNERFRAGIDPHGRQSFILICFMIRERAIAWMPGGGLEFTGDEEGALRSVRRTVAPVPAG